MREQKEYSDDANKEIDAEVEKKIEDVNKPEPNDEFDASKNVAEEFGGPKGQEPTTYGDWQKNGRCIDF